MKNNISTKELVKAAKDCSHRAIERATVLGITYSVRKENKLVQINPIDGSEKVLKELPPRIAYTGKRLIKL